MRNQTRDVGLTHDLAGFRLPRPVVQSVGGTALDQTTRSMRRSRSASKMRTRTRCSQSGRNPWRDASGRGPCSSSQTGPWEPNPQLLPIAQRRGAGCGEHRLRRTRERRGASYPGDCIEVPARSPATAPRLRRRPGYRAFKRIDAGVREPLAAEGEAIRTDLEALRAAVVCP